MKILIGITSKNRINILPKAIEASLNQSYPDKEIWVYDDASTDNTISLKDVYLQINWIFSNIAHGYLYARNLFMQKEGYDYFCSLDDDAWFINNEAIQKALEFMNSNPDVGALGFDMLSPDAPNQNTEVPHFLETNNFIGCGHIINLKAAKEIGYYIPNPGFYGGEEKDFCIRLIENGYKIITYKGMYVWHDKTMVARDLPKQHQSGVCNDLVFTYRRAPFMILIPSLLVKLYKHLKFSSRYKRENLLKPCIKGFRDFLRWLVFEKTNRKPVTLKAFNLFLELGKK